MQRKDIPSTKKGIHFGKYKQYEVYLPRYEKGSRIGGGVFSEVFKVKERYTGKIYAAKVINCSGDKQICNNVIEKEVKIMIKARHPTIIQLIGYSKKNFFNEFNVTIIMEFIKDGSLAEIIRKNKLKRGPLNYTNTNRQIILAGIACGMKYLHKKNIIHRDLKTDNILVDDNYHPKITDFGLSKTYRNSQSNVQTDMHSNSQYISPKSKNDENSCNLKVDVYDFAFLMYEVVTDMAPHPEVDSKKKAALILHRPQFTSDVKKPIRELIEKCWSSDEDERPTFEEIYDKLTCFCKKSGGVTNEDCCLENVDIEKFRLYVEEHCEYPLENDDTSESDDLDEENQQTTNRESECQIYKLKLENEAVVKHDLKSGQKKNEIKNEGIDIMVEQFNCLALNEKLAAVINLMNYLKGFAKQFYTNVMTLLKYLSNIQQIEDFEFIEIIANRNNQHLSEVDEKSEIYFKSKTTEILYTNKSFGPKSQFIQILKSFNHFSIELTYPTENFDDMMRQVISIRTSYFKRNHAIFLISILIIGNEKLKYEKDIDEVIFFTPIFKIENNYFFKFRHLKRLIIPSSVTSIGDYAFSGCKSLTNISIPSSVTSIRWGAFSGCSSLTQISIPSFVKSIGGYAFSGCSSLTQISLPSSVTSIEYHAFSECSSLTQISIPSSVTSIGEYAFFGCSSLANISIPPSITSIKWSVFYGCSSLKQISIPSSVTSIEGYAFSGCLSLIKISIPSSVTSIGKYAFRECSSLKQITVPSSVTSIGEYAFPSKLKITRN